MNKEQKPGNINYNMLTTENFRSEPQRQTTC